MSSHWLVAREFPSSMQENMSRLITKPKKRSVRPAKTQISLGIRPVWSVFAVRMKIAWVFSYPLTATDSRVRVPLEARFFPNLNGASLQRAFHVHPSTVPIWLKIFWKGCKTLTHPHQTMICMTVQSLYNRLLNNDCTVIRIVVFESVVQRLHCHT